MRRYHAFAGLAGIALVMFMAITGFLLSLQPLIEAVSVAPAHTEQSVAALAAAVADREPGVERLVRSASGRVVAYASDGSSHTAQVIDPDTGATLGDYQPSAFFSFVTELHRAFLTGSAGHAAAGISAVAILVLSASGLTLLIGKMGGWRHLLGRARGTGAQRLHTNLARLAFAVLLLTAASGLYMSAVYFELLPAASEDVFQFAPSGEGSAPAPIASLHGLAGVPLSDLRELVFPVADDASDVFTVTTGSGQFYVDQATGDILAPTPNNPWQQVYELAYVLHTGQGAWILAAMLGLGALAVPALAVTGTAIWWQRRGNTLPIRGNADHRDADTVILVGSESGSTWGFAAALHEALSAQGCRVHAAAMNELRRSYPQARRLLVLTATYGDGAAPASARHFLGRLGAFGSHPQFAVLGFGDQGFPDFCGYAAVVEEALLGRGLQPLLPLHTVDRQSSGDFAAWGTQLAERLGMQLALSHVPAAVRTQALVLEERIDYGTEVQAPIAVLRFSRPRTHRPFPLAFGRRSLPRFEAGDLVGIVPPGGHAPRYYSLASASRDGVLEICVRLQPGGVCSEYLHGLTPGDAIEAFVRPNPEFRPSAKRRPLILVGAGAGVAPLVGFVRSNTRRRPVHMFFGARDPGSDFLYGDELREALADGRLASFTTAFSRVLGGGYVQDRLADEGEALQYLVQRGAQIMVCGSRQMATGVREAIDGCLAPLGLSTDSLRRQGRYLEDAY